MTKFDIRNGIGVIAHIEVIPVRKKSQERKCFLNDRTPARYPHYLLYYLILNYVRVRVLLIIHTIPVSTTYCLRQTAAAVCPG